jgi:hypothetical protein
MMANARDSHGVNYKLQFHYWFSDKSHTMDALVHNKCERELLELTKAVAKLCGVAIKMETEPSGKGGLKSWLSILAKSPKRTPSVKIALVNVLVAASVVTPNHKTTNSVVEALLAKLMTEEELDKANRNQFQQEISALKLEAANLLPLLDQNGVVKKRRSNFYDLLRKYQKVKSVSVALTDDVKKPVTEEQLIAREDFKSFIVSSNVSVPQVIENAQIEIISPVLMKGKHKWKGLYLGEAISFVMKSDDFMSLVQSGKVEFKSGSTIACTLQIEKKINGIGVERIIGYNILGVGSYSENGKTTETPEAKQKQKHATVSKRQLDLFG